MNKRKKREKFNEIVQGIKDVRIQGAQNISKQALYAYSLVPGKKSRKKLLSLRPTEPLLRNILNKVETEKEKNPYTEILNHFKEIKEKINEYSLKIIKNKDVIFTHCHSSTVVNALINAKKHKKKFEVYATETRPLFQGRKTAKELSQARIKTTFFPDSAAMIALTKGQGTKKVKKFFLGADAILKEGVINKVGSGMFAQIAHDNKIPLYIFTDSWKYSKEKLNIEQRSFLEIWRNAPKKLKIKNPAFEFIPKKYIKAIVSEYGILSYSQFLKKV